MGEVNSDQNWRISFTETKGFFTPSPRQMRTLKTAVKRAHLTILDSVRTLLSDTQLPKRFWAYTVHLPRSDNPVPIAKFDLSLV